MTGLAENQQLETDLQDLPSDDDYYWNLQATITQQIDCLRELGRLDEADQRWREAQDLLPRITEYRAEAEARLLGQLAHLRREQDAMDAALDAASQAVQLAVANHCPAVLIAELRHTRADLLRQVGRDREAVEELNATANTPMPQALRSRFLHLKALLLEQHGAPQALEHLLESYQQDRLRGDDAGVAISLLAIARIFTEEHEYDRARERIREALPLADACGLVNARSPLGGHRPSRGEDHVRRNLAHHGTEQIRRERGRGWRCTRDAIARHAPSTSEVTTSRSLCLGGLVQVAEAYWPGNGVTVEWLTTEANFKQTPFNLRL
ncbi:MAG TPA: hypothetical protein VGV87_12275, partial [Blastocatellia bacterium]|nr:hypothetical protein [Blastocatellia bacterium]